MADKFEYKVETMDANDKVIGLAMLLMSKGVITKEELDEALLGVIEAKNKALEEERKKNPGAAWLLDMMAGGMDAGRMKK